MYDGEDVQARVKEALVKALGGDSKALVDVQIRFKQAGDVLGEALEEGLVELSQIEGLGDSDAMVQ